MTIQGRGRAKAKLPPWLLHAFVSMEYSSNSSHKLWLNDLLLCLTPRFIIILLSLRTYMVDLIINLRHLNYRCLCSMTAFGCQTFIYTHSCIHACMPKYHYEWNHTDEFLNMKKVWKTTKMRRTMKIQPKRPEQCRVDGFIRDSISNPM